MIQSLKSLKNISAIEKRVHKACQSLNFPLKSNNITPGLLLTQLNEIYDQAESKFKVQMGIGRILRNKELSTANRNRAKKLIELAPGKFMSFMTNAAHNVMKGNLELDPECYKNLRKKRQKMLDVGWVKSKKERKRNLRKHGASSGRELSKVVLSAL